MTSPIESVVRVAASPAQAKIFVAMLQAEGIPARTDGDSLADEFAASRRLMNLLGTEVYVPTSSLERAREILQPVAVDPEELEREALATPGETYTPAVPSGPGRTPIVLLLVAFGAAALFAVLWQGAATRLAEWEDTARRVNQESEYPFDYVPQGKTLREVRRRDGRTVRVLHDADADGLHERVDTLDAAGNVIVTADDFVDGVHQRVVEMRDGLTTTWVDADRNGVLDSARVTDGAGRLVQTIEWQPGRGYVIKTP